MSASEDRGTRYYVFKTCLDDLQRSILNTRFYCSFSFHPESLSQWCVSVPIGWSLQPDEKEGVVLQNLFYERVTATDALQRALSNKGGFKVVKDWK